MDAIRRVLVVDDDRDLCDLLADFLRDEGYEVARAYAGREALDSAKRAVPDAVLLDLMLPDISGLTVGQALRADAATERVKLVVISGDRGALAAGRAALGGALFLEKPFSLDAIEVAVRDALGRDGPAAGA
jgi:two-component system phosphate regulon response regulator PhoB